MCDIFFTEFFSYLLYTIAKEKEEGAGKSALATIVEKIMTESRVHGVLVNSRTINVFRKKCGLLNADIKRERKKCGGSGIKRLQDKWSDQTYAVKIFYHEIDNYLIEKENQDLRGQKRTVEESLEEETTKRLKLEEKLDKAERSCSFLRRRFQRLVKKVAKMNKKGAWGPEKNLLPSTQSTTKVGLKSN